MAKFLQRLLLLALFAMPLAMTAQTGVERTYLDEDFAVVAPEGWMGSTDDVGMFPATTEAPSWTYSEYTLNGLAGGHYYQQMWKAATRWIISPEIDLTESGEATLSFDLALTEQSGTAAPATVSADKKVMLLISVNGGGWTPLISWAADTASGDSLITTIPNTYRTYTVNMAQYLGNSVRVAFYTEVTVPQNEAIAIHLDNVSVTGKIRTQPVVNLAVSDVTTNSVTVTWDDTLNTQTPSFYRVSIYDGDVLVSTLDVDGYAAKTATFTGLNSNTNYTVRVVTYADANTFSVMYAVEYFRTNFEFQSITRANPFNCDFEDGIGLWQFSNATYNYWMYAPETAIDSVDSSAVVFNHCLWITNDGVNNAYTNNRSTYSYAYLPVSIEAGIYDLSFDWRGYGENNYDYLQVYLAPEETSIVGSNVLTGVAELSGRLCKQNDWVGDTVRISVPEGGNYHIVFMWKNDGSGGTNPPASFDNVSIASIACYPVDDLVVLDSLTTSNSLTIGFNDPWNEGATYVAVAIHGEDTIPMIVDAGTFVIENLLPETTYEITVYTMCGLEFSEFATVYGTTNPLCFAVTDLSADSLTRSSAIISWNDERNVGATHTLVVRQGNTLVDSIVNAVSPVALSGLAALTDYTATVIAYANDTNSVASIVFATLPVDNIPCSTVEISNGTATTSYVPTYSYYKYSLSQVIVGADEMGGAKTLDKVMLHVGGSGKTRTMDIYIQPIEDDVFSGTNSIPLSADAVQVFSGTVPFTVGWYTIEFTTPYEYDGNTNLLFIFDDNTGSYSNGMNFYGDNVSGKALYRYDDNTNYDPYVSNSLQASTVRPAMLFPCVPPTAEMTVAVSDRTMDGALFTWENPLAFMGEEATEYHVVVMNDEGVVIDETVNDLTYTATGLTATTAYTVIVSAVYADGMVLASDAVAFETMGLCNAPDNFAAVATRSTISLSWEQADVSIETYQLYYDTVAVNPDAVSAYLTVNGNEGYTILDLDPETTYYIYFRANCGENQSMWRNAVVTTLPSLMCSNEPIGTSSGTSTNIPTNSYWKYSLTEAIYTAEEIGAGTISSISYNIQSNPYTRTLDIYLMPTTESSLSSMVSIDETAVLVYSGSYAFAEGWNEIAFNAPYVFDGNSNLMVIVDDNTGSYENNNNFYTDAVSGKARYVRSDNTNYDPTSSYSMTTTNRPWTKFNVCVEAPACAAVSEIVVSDIDYNTATLTWERPDCKVNGYLLVVSDAELADPSTADNIETLGDINTYVLPGLAQNAAHYAYLGTLCGNGDTAWAYVSFETPAFCRVATNLVATVNGKNTVLLSWESTSENQPANYSYIISTVELTEDDLANYDGTIVSGIEANEVQINTGLDYNTTYYAYVRNVCTLNGNDAFAPWAGPAIFTTGIQMPAVLNLAASSYRNTVTATWESDSANYADETQWRVAIVEHDSVPTTWATANERTYEWNGLAFAARYDVYVAAIDGAATSDTVMTSVFTGIEMPAVTNVHLTQLSHNYAEVAWEQGFNAIETTWAFSFKEANDTNALAYTLTDHMDSLIYGLRELTSYEVRIAAIMGDKSSDTVLYTFTTPSRASALSACYTVADGTTTNSNLPVYGLWADAPQHTQSIYPESMLQGMMGKTITGMTYYAISDASWNGVWQVSVGTTSNTSLASGFDATPTTAVYNGTLAVVDGVMSIVLDEPFTYNGGNLLVDFNLPTGANFKGTDFRGQSTTGTTSRRQYNSSVATYSFLPKVDFCYEGQYIQSLAITDITETSANASWMPGGYENEWQYVNVEGTLTNDELEAAEKTTTNEQNAALTGLTADRDYTFYVRAHETLDSVANVVYVFDSIHTWYDTTYSRENPLEQIVVTHNDTIMKLLYDENITSHNDTIWSETEQDSVVVEIFDTAYTLHYNVEYNVEWYSDWGKIAYSTLRTCDEPIRVVAACEAPDSAVVLALTAADALNFRYAVAGSGEYTVVPGIADTIHDTVDAQLVYNPEDLDTIWAGYNEDFEYVESDTAFAGYSVYTYEWVDEVESFIIVAEGAEPIDTTYTVDSIPYFFAYLTQLQPTTTYVVDAQSVCGENSVSRWSGNVVFTTEDDFVCGVAVDMPFVETFGDESLTRSCWNVVYGDNEPVLDSTLEANVPEYYNGALYPFGYVSDTAYVPAFDSAERYNRYFISPELAETEGTLIWNASYAVNRYDDRDYYGDRYYSDNMIAFGYSTTNDSLESFTWSEFEFDSTYYAGSLSYYNQYLPAGTKYVAFHVIGSNPEWAAIEHTEVYEAGVYTINAYNANAEMGSVVVTIDGDTAETTTNVTFLEGQVALIVAEANNGYRFTGWEAIDANNHRVNVSNYGTIRPYTDTTVIANFDINMNTVHVGINDANAGTVAMKLAGEDTAASITVPHGSQITLVAVDTNAADHKSFRGWALGYGSDVVSYESTYTFNLDAVNNNATQNYTALFVQDSFYVTANVNDTNMGYVIGGGAHPLSTTNFTMTAVVKYGHEFVNWLDAEGEVLTTNLSFDTVNVDSSDMSFTAVFQKIPFYALVGVNDASLGTATAVPDHGLYLDTLVFTATATAEHYHFQYWSDGVTDNPYLFAITQDTIMTAFFAIDTHKVILLAREDMGTATFVDNPTDSAWFNYGSENIMIQATPNTGVAFTQWSDGVVDNPRAISVMSDTSFTAEFDSIVYNVVARTNEVEGLLSAYDGTPMPDSTVLTGRYGDTLVVVATANNGYKFTSWLDNEGNSYFSDTLEYVVNALEFQSFTANFAEAGKVTVITNVNIADAGTAISYGISLIQGEQYDTNSIDGYNRYNHDVDVMMVATPAEHYHFLNWTYNGEVYATTDTAYVHTDTLVSQEMTFTANFEIDTHVVRFVAVEDYMGSFTVNGVAVDSAYADYDGDLVVTAVPAAHYHLVAWVDGENVVTTDAENTVHVMGDTTVYATFEIDTHYVNVTVNDTNMGTATGSGWYSYGDTAVLTATAKYGYHVDAWSNTETTETISIVVRGDVTMNVNFAVNVYDVTAVVNEEGRGTVTGAHATEHFASDTLVAVANYGYQFDSWTDVNDNVLTEGVDGATIIVSPISDTVVKANFTKNVYNVFVSSANPQLGSAIASAANAEYLDTVTITATPTVEGYHFTGWVNMYGDIVSTEDVLGIEVAGDTMLLATFGINSYNVSVSSADPTMGTATASATTADHGVSVTFTAIPAEGYRLASWSNGETTEVINVPVTSDTTLVATFAVATYAVAVQVNNPTMGTATVSANTAEQGETVTFTATANAGYQFIGWSNGATTESITVTVVSDTVLTANFAGTTYSVAAAVNNATMGSAFASDATVNYNDAVTFTAVPNAHYRFVSWSNGATTATTTINVVSDTTLTATFEAINYTVALTSDNETMGTVSAGGTYQEGTEITVTATANSGYHFVAWMEGTTVVSTNAAYTFEVTKNVTLTATFAANTVYVTITASVDDPVKGYVIGAGEYEYGSEVSLTAVANPGYFFISWNTGETTPTITFTATADATRVASFGRIGIDDVDMENVTIYSTDSKIIVRGAEGQSIYVYDVNGRVISHMAEAAETSEFRMSDTGVFLVKVGNAPAKRVLVVR